MTVSRRTLLAAAGTGGLMVGGSRTLRAQTGPTMGAALYQRVAGYSQWPHHRTGTPEGKDTVDWFEAQLRELGAATSRWSYAYDRYDWRVSVTADGRPVDALPLYYEGVGELATDAPFVRPVTLANNFDTSDLEQALAEAKDSDLRLAVFLTFGRFGNLPPRPALIGVNVDPDKPKSGLPTVLVSGVHLDAMASGAVTAAVSAQRVADRAANVFGRLGTGDGAPLVITTPLTGWFTCAGERGTGIAVALELARSFAAEMPVAVIATTGHELENYGIRQQLKAGLGFAPRAVIHIGASLAAGWFAPGSGALQLFPGRLAAANRPIDGDSPLATAFKAGAFQPAPRFFGEAKEWAAHLPETTPLLSFAGSFPLFHTPQDTPEAATSPALLQTVFSAVRDAAKAVLG
ncbi:hypothetical protein [Reyranella sp. CPCC 100927]|uniref:hypothetical protein n=1 Tax=Reyranella sp. CPCC 100927 TaxID=2599616 RepID=UPI0011B547A5|nr:hypothetical protein [Reyranella sp. CPCC 100927]TWT10846.1 hypothetical protein FQU96_17245 [Reyranella sp. CPCC 100927]